MPEEPGTHVVWCGGCNRLIATLPIEAGDATIVCNDAADTELALEAIRKHSCLVSNQWRELNHEWERWLAPPTPQK